MTEFLPEARSISFKKLSQKFILNVVNVLNNAFVLDNTLKYVIKQI